MNLRLLLLLSAICCQLFSEKKTTTTKQPNSKFLHIGFFELHHQIVYPRDDLPFQSKWTTQLYFGMKRENRLQHSMAQARTQGQGSGLHPGRTQEPSVPHIILLH